jgi:cytochrome c oxidase assembly protein subunit 15/protoheme IX farnesyltransferase
MAWAALAYTLFVILFGAVVRITGSGAGCGQHWPTCHGEVVHLPQSVETAIEFTHRLTSGIALLVAIGLAWLARRSFSPGHTARRAAAWGLALMVVEALIGASLVLLELVGRNDSPSRAVAMAAHLVNTSLLTAALAVCAWAGSRRQSPAWRLAGASRVLWSAALLGVLLVSVTGAVTALGDTLYPVSAGADLSARIGGTGDHFLARLRIVHPVLAALVSALLLYVAVALPERAPRSAARPIARSLIALVIVQVAAGLLNVVLSAPAWLQVAHLGLATLAWINLVLLGLAAGSPVARAHSEL